MQIAIMFWQLLIRIKKALELLQGYGVGPAFIHKK